MRGRFFNSLLVAVPGREVVREGRPRHVETGVMIADPLPRVEHALRRSVLPRHLRADGAKLTAFRERWNVFRERRNVIRLRRNVIREQESPIRGTRTVFRGRRKVFRERRDVNSGPAEREIFAANCLSWHAAPVS